MDVTFRTKVRTLIDAYDRRRDYVKLPTITRHHCDMQAARCCPEWGGITNSDLFLGAVNGAVSKLASSSGFIYLDSLPDCVSVDTSGFLAEVTISNVSRRQPSASVAVPKLFKLRADLTLEEATIVSAAGLEAGEVYWLHGSRPSSLGGYLGTYSPTYRQANGYSPTLHTISNMPTRYFQPVA